MSDLLITNIITGLVTPIILFVLTHYQNKKIKEAADKIKETSEKVDAYHKEVNGKMGELIETTKALGVAEGTATEKAKKK